MAVVTFNARFVDALVAPATGQCDYWDRTTPGFGLRVSFGGRKAWVVRYHVNGRLRRLTLGPYPTIGLADARDRARAALLQVASGSDPAAAKQAARHAETFGELTLEYMEHYAKIRKKSWRDDERTIKAELLPEWKHTPLKE